MTGMEEFLKVFGNFTVGNMLEIILACGFLYIFYKKVKKFLDEQYAHQEKEKEKEKLRVEKLDNISNKMDLYIKQQGDINKQLNLVIVTQNKQQIQLDDIQASIQEREKNKLNDRLLQSYNYYNNPDKNPMKAWTSIESSAFWGLFKEYEKAGGNGFMHSTVQPAMKMLRVIDINDADEIANLMQNRH